MSPDRPLIPKHALFVAHYRASHNATEAYVQAYGAKRSTAGSEGARLLKDPRIAAAIAQADAEVVQKLGIDPERALLEAWHIATVDMRELVEYLVGCCRYCYGEGNRYQRTTAEYNTAFEKWTIDRANKKRGTPLEFDPAGGIGYDPRKPPVAACPECVGRGVGQLHLKDTRGLSPAAVAAYAGVKQSQHGIEVKAHDKLAALEKIFRHLNLYEEENKDKSPLAEAMASFIGKIHGDGSGRAPVVGHSQIRRVK